MNNAYIKSTAVLAAAIMLSLPSYAQFGNILNKAKDAAGKAERVKAMVTPNETVKADLSIPVSGKIYYVSPNGSNRNDATSPETAVKDLQKAIDLAEEGSAIYIAEGNYLGKLDQGYIEVKKYLSLVGGWKSDFSERNPVKYISSIRPGAGQVGTSGSHASLEVYVRGKRNAAVLIDGIAFDKGQYNSYCSYAPNDARTGSPDSGS